MLKENTYYRVRIRFVKDHLTLDEGDIVLVNRITYNYYSDFTQSKVYSVSLVLSDFKKLEFEHNKHFIECFEEII